MEQGTREVGQVRTQGQGHYGEVKGKGEIGMRRRNARLSRSQGRSLLSFKPHASLRHSELVER